MHPDDPPIKISNRVFLWAVVAVVAFSALAFVAGPVEDANSNTEQRNE